MYMCNKALLISLVLKKAFIYEGYMYIQYIPCLLYIQAKCKRDEHSVVFLHLKNAIFSVMECYLISG